MWRFQLPYHFPFLSSKIPSSPAYGVFISQLIRYARACSSYECFILRTARLSSKLLGQAYARERLKSSLRKFYGRYGDLVKHYEVPSPRCCVTFWDIEIYSDTLNWSDIAPILEAITGPCFQFSPYYQISGGFHRTLQRVRLANRGRLLLRTPGPVPFGTCICSNLETILSSGLQVSMNVHRGALLLVTQWQCISSFVFYIFPNLSGLRTFWVSNIPRYFYFAILTVNLI